MRAREQAETLTQVMECVELLAYAIGAGLTFPVVFLLVNINKVPRARWFLTLGVFQ